MIPRYSPPSITNTDPMFLSDMIFNASMTFVSGVTATAEAPLRFKISPTLFMCFLLVENWDMEITKSVFLNIIILINISDWRDFFILLVQMGNMYAYMVFF